MLLEGMRNISSKWLASKWFRGLYHIMQTAYHNNQVHLDKKGFMQALVESPDITDSNKQGIDNAYSLAEYYDIELTEDSFKNAMVHIIEKEKKKIFDAGIMNAIKLRRNNLKKAEETLKDTITKASNITVGDSLVTLSKASRFAMDEYRDKEHYYFDTYSDKINRITGGGKKGDTWFVGGFSNDGKSIMCLNLIMPSIISKHKVLWIPLESTTKDLHQMITVYMAELMGMRWITSEKVRLKQLSGDEEDKYNELQNHIIDNINNLFIYKPKSRFTIKDLELEIDKIQSHFGLDIVVIDYLELLDNEYKKENTEYRIKMKELARKASQIATQKNVWFISPWQVNRDGRKRAEERAAPKRNKLPQPPYYTIYDLQESSGAEQNAKVVTWIYQDEELRAMKKARTGLSKVKSEAFVSGKGWDIETDFAHCKLIENEEIEDLENDEKLPI